MKLTNRSMAILASLSLLAICLVLCVVIYASVDNVVGEIFSDYRQHSDCNWDFEIYTWQDDGDGLSEKGEIPLSGVSIEVTNLTMDDSWVDVSDSSGSVKIDSFGWCEFEWEIIVKPPLGFTATTKTEIITNTPGIYEFGFQKDE